VGIKNIMLLLDGFKDKRKQYCASTRTTATMKATGDRAVSAYSPWVWNGVKADSRA